MYLVGAEHPNKTAALQTLHRLVARRERLVTDAEVFQEILHRYKSLQRMEQVAECFELLLDISYQVLPIDLELVQQAHEVVLQTPNVSARDAIHVASMRRAGIREIFTFDVGFDQVPNIVRIS